MDDTILDSDQSEPENKNDSGSLGKELLEQIEKARTMLATLESLTRNGEIQKTLFEEIAVKIGNEMSEIRGAKSTNTKLANELNKGRAEITGFLDEARTKTNEIKGVLKLLQALKIKLENKGEFIESMKTDVIEKKKEITAINGALKKLFKNTASINNNAGIYLQKIKENGITAEEIVKTLLNIQKQADNNAKNLQDYYENGKKSFEKIEIAKNDIDNIFSDSEQKQLKIKMWYEKLFGDKGTKSEIEKIENKIHAQQAEIDRQLADAAANRLCASFEKKVSSLKVELTEWKNRTKYCVYTLVVLNTVASLVSIFYHKEVAPLEHIAIITPIIFLLIFSSLEYVKTKRFLEEYNFKYILAYAMPAYFELIETRGGSQEALKYIVETTNTIHQNVADKILGKDASKSTVLDYLGDIMHDLLREKLDPQKIIEEGLTNKLMDYVGQDKGGVITKQSNSNTETTRSQSENIHSI